MTLVEKFTAKYGINPIKLVEDANLEFFGAIKSLGLKKILEEYIDKKDLKIELTDEFFIELVECFAEAGEKFPENQKAPELVGASFEIPNQKVSIPKSKGTLENFKGIVGADELRPIMSGVYVSEDGFLVGTDAHKLVKLRTNEFSSDKGKIIDLAKYIKSKGKILDFIDGKYPNYEAVIPKENLEEKALSTYAFYNLAKSAQDVKRLTSNEVFNINLRLKTDDDKTEVFAFSYIIMLEALTFAMANGWDFFTLEYSTPSRAVVLNFGDGNLALVMPVMVRDNEVKGAKIMTPEEIEENYRLGLSNQKASKSKTTKPARPSAPVSSEPYKKFEGNIGDTTYIHRSQIDSIKLVSGEVLGKNDIIDGVYRVNNKLTQDVNKKYSNKDLHEINNGRAIWYPKMTKSRLERILKKQELDQNDIEDLEDFKYLILAEPQNAYEVGLMDELKVSQKERAFSPKNNFWLTNIDRRINEKKSKEKMAHGGSTNSYSNKNSEEVWNSWNINQREHFLSDHMITTSKTMDKRISLYRFDELPIDLVNVIEYKLKEHIKRGSYADGGSMYAGGGKIDPIDMAEVESSAIFYTEKGKWSPEPTVEKFENQIREYQEMKRALDNNEIRPSKIIGTGLKPQYVRPLAYRWLEERTLIAKRAIEILKERMGGSTPSSHEIGDTVTFNSVLGGTKTGTIISKIGDEGFRIKTGDGFATVKKSAIV